jgi:hypothetical protein
MLDPGKRLVTETASFAQFLNATVSKVLPTAVAGPQEVR